MKPDPVSNRNAAILQLVEVMTPEWKSTKQLWNDCNVSSITLFYKALKAGEERGLWERREPRTRGVQGHYRKTADAVFVPDPNDDSVPLTLESLRSTPAEDAGQTFLLPLEHLLERVTKGNWHVEETSHSWMLFADGPAQPWPEGTPQHVIDLLGPNAPTHPMQLCKAPKLGSSQAEYWPNPYDSELIVRSPVVARLLLEERRKHDALKTVILELSDLDAQHRAFLEGGGGLMPDYMEHAEKYTAGFERVYAKMLEQIGVENPRPTAHRAHTVDTTDVEGWDEIAFLLPHALLPKFTERAARHGSPTSIIRAALATYWAIQDGHLKPVWADDESPLDIT